MSNKIKVATKKLKEKTVEIHIYKKKYLLLTQIF